MLGMLGSIPFLWKALAVALLAGGLVTACVVRDRSLHNAGREEALAEVEAANKEMADAARKAVGNARACRERGGMWNQSSGECEGGM